MEDWYLREKLRFNWYAPDGNVELLNFKLEVTYTLGTRALNIIHEEKILFIKNKLGQEDLLVIVTFTQGKMRNVKPQGNKKRNVNLKGTVLSVWL